MGAEITNMEINSPTIERVERDGIGQLQLPTNVLYGINVARSLANFPISGRSIASWPSFVRAFSLVKQAAARANSEIGCLGEEQARAIFDACEGIKAGKYDNHLVVDMLEGSGGTSTNMNFNEVIANIATKSLRQTLSEHCLPIHPNDHVNMGQSTNDVLPTAMKLAIYYEMENTTPALLKLADAFAKKREELSSVLRLGRTCLQDAQPMTYGQAFGGYEAVIRRHAQQLELLRKQFLVLPLGGTAIGTGFGSRPGYKLAVYRHLSCLSGVQVSPAADPFDAMQNMDTCARLSAELRNTANTLSKISNDFITLSSGPGGGIGEISLPEVQAGSSIMPGKVNPVIPMAVCQVSFAIAGNDASISMACHQGMLEINHFEMVVCDRLLDSIRLLASTATVFSSRCVEGMRANKEVSYKHLLASSALATALVPELGYARVSSLVRQAQAEQRPFLEVAIEKGSISEHEVVKILNRSAQVEKMGKNGRSQ